VLLNGNVGFLAIQSVDNLDTKLSSAAQISSYLSIVASVGSILLGLLLRRQTKNKVMHKADDVVRLSRVNFNISYFTNSHQQAYLNDNSHPLLGLEVLAILHSLPYALFMWA